jgi:hypothetical protein
MLSGFNRGLQLIADFLHLLYWAITTQNDDATLDLLNVARQWFKELTGAQIDAKSYNLRSIALSIALGADPFSVSRAMFRDIAAKYHH